jgi:mannose-6-phosphate isomerase-like protein (cupin superfamily)
MSDAKPPSAEALRATTTFVHLAEGGDATPLPVTDTFWTDLTSGRLGDLDGGRLVSACKFTSDWDAWERHPAGDELVCLLSGAMTFVLDTPGGQAEIRLDEPGAFLLVPRGTWHTARVHNPSLGLFVTAGAGTEHRPA